MKLLLLPPPPAGAGACASAVRTRAGGHEEAIAAARPKRSCCERESVRHACQRPQPLAATTGPGFWRLLLIAHLPWKTWPQRGATAPPEASESSLRQAELAAGLAGVHPRTSSTGTESAFGSRRWAMLVSLRAAPNNLQNARRDAGLRPGRAEGPRPRCKGGWWRGIQHAAPTAPTAHNVQCCHPCCDPCGRHTTQPLTVFSRHMHVRVQGAACTCKRHKPVAARTSSALSRWCMCAPAPAQAKTPASPVQAGQQPECGQRRLTSHAPSPKEQQRLTPHTGTAAGGSRHASRHGDGEAGGGGTAAPPRTVARAAGSTKREHMPSQGGAQAYNPAVWLAAPVVKGAAARPPPQ